MPNVPDTKSGTYARIYKPSNQITFAHPTLTQMAAFPPASAFLFAFHQAHTDAAY